MNEQLHIPRALLAKEAPESVCTVSRVENILPLMVVEPRSPSVKPVAMPTELSKPFNRIRSNLKNQFTRLTLLYIIILAHADSSRMNRHNLLALHIVSLKDIILVPFYMHQPSGMSTHLSCHKEICIPPRYSQYSQMSK
jgi:hypothetical protein